MDKELLLGLVGEALESEDLHDCFLVDIQIQLPRIEIFIDSDEEVTFEKCKKISRHIENVLDAKQYFGDRYILEVSSAGVGRPLRFPRQYIKNIGRTVELKTESGRLLKGTIKNAGQENFSIEWEDSERVGRKRTKIKKEELFSYSDIQIAKIKISFN
ncbi:MAG TPA: hypothetical protein PKC30_04615 [Saprospiraceae bacterium]|nr:hypothetical protein [Saprospiraceae bacterium]